MLFEDLDEPEGNILIGRCIGSDLGGIDLDRGFSLPEVKRETLARNG